MEAEAGRREVGLSLLQQVTQMAQNPFSPTLAGIAAGATGAGGGISPYMAAFQRTGGVGQPAPPEYFDVATNLLRELSIYAGAAGINPQTGLPYTAKEIAYLNILQQRQAPQPRASVI
jgi:hypothetical protein